MAARIFNQFPTNNLRLRADLIDNMVGTPLNYKLGTLTNVYNPCYVSGGTWVWAPDLVGTQPLNVVMSRYRGRYFQPFFYFTPGSTTITDLTNAYNFGWDYGDSITGYNEYGDQYMGTDTGFRSVTSYFNSNIYTVRQVVYNSTKGQLAVRVTAVNNPAGRSQFIERVVLAPYSSSGAVSSTWNIYQGNSAISYNEYVVASDYTSVWVWNATGLPTSPVGVSFQATTG